MVPGKPSLTSPTFASDGHHLDTKVESPPDSGYNQTFFRAEVY